MESREPGVGSWTFFTSFNSLIPDVKRRYLSTSGMKFLSHPFLHLDRMKYNRGYPDAE